ncbi:TolC family protein, partial [Bacteroides cellulosilyticus]
MNMKYLLISLILLPLTGTAQTYTLEECCRLALEQNAKIKTATNDRSVAVMEKKEAFTNFLPSVSLMGGAMKADDAMLQMAMGDQTMKLMDGGMYGSVMASLPIYAGGKILNGHKLAELGVEISELQLHQTQNEVKLTVARYYWQIVVLTEKLRTLESVRELLDNMNRDVNHAVEAGIRKRNDLLQVQLRKNDTQSAFIDVEKNLEVCKMLLAQYMG